MCHTVAHGVLVWVRCAYGNVYTVYHAPYHIWAIYVMYMVVLAMMLLEAEERQSLPKYSLGDQPPSGRAMIPSLEHFHSA